MERHPIHWHTHADHGYVELLIVMGYSIFADCLCNVPEGNVTAIRANLMCSSVTGRPDWQPCVVCGHLVSARLTVGWISVRRACWLNSDRSAESFCSLCFICHLDLLTRLELTVSATGLTSYKQDAAPKQCPEKKASCSCRLSTEYNVAESPEDGFFFRTDCQRWCKINRQYRCNFTNVSW